MDGYRRSSMCAGVLARTAHSLYRSGTGRNSEEGFGFKAVASAPPLVPGVTGSLTTPTPLWWWPESSALHASYRVGHKLSLEDTQRLEQMGCIWVAPSTCAYRRSTSHWHRKETTGPFGRDPGGPAAALMVEEALARGGVGEGVFRTMLDLPWWCVDGLRGTFCRSATRILSSGEGGRGH